MNRKNREISLFEKILEFVKVTELLYDDVIENITLEIYPNENLQLSINYQNDRSISLEEDY